MNILPALKRGIQVVVLGPHAAREEASPVVAQLAMRGPLTILDGGNRFQAYRVAQLIRRQTTEVHAAAARLFIQRAFTCYQMLALLENTPARPQPCLVLDLLATFYDDHVPTHEAGRLLEACLSQLQRLQQAAPLAITLGPPRLEERTFLIERVCAQADTLFKLALPPPEPSQPGLF